MALPWVVVTGAMALIFCGMFVVDQIQPSVTVARSIGDAVQYWPSFIGLPWSRSGFLAMPASVIGVGLVIVALALSGSRLKGAARLETIAIAFVLFSLGCSIFAAIGRRGLHEPFPPVRYSIFMMPLHLAVLFFVLIRKWLSERIAVAVLSVLIAQQLLAGYMAVHVARSLGVPVGFGGAVKNLATMPITCVAAHRAADPDRLICTGLWKSVTSSADVANPPHPLPNILVSPKVV